MRPSQFGILASLALTRPVSANFFIYAITIQNNIGELNFDGYRFYSSEPSCSDTELATLHGTDDVTSSGGVRCEGCSSALGTDVEPTELEWKSNEGHYTWYLNRGGNLVDLDDKVVGKCKVHDSDGFTCFDSSTATTWGQSQLWCDTDVKV